MGYISKYDTCFLTFASRKYSKYKVQFEFWDDYILWLYYDYFGTNEELYYNQLEKDLWEYVEFQSGKERDRRGKLSAKWKKNEVRNLGIKKTKEV